MNHSYTVSFCPAPDWTQVPTLELLHTGWLKPCPVAAKAQCCRDENGLWVRMEAQEAEIRATLTGPLEAICTDSCLEFFFAPRTDDHRYFNFEFNPLGAMYLGFGGKRATRVRQIVKNPQSLFRPEPFFTETGWGIQFYIPLEFLRVYYPDYRFEGEAACNFYKCGDLTVVPHYLAWAPLHCDTPDYHRQEDFGRLLFE